MEGLFRRGANSRIHGRYVMLYHFCYALERQPPLLCWCMMSCSRHDVYWQSKEGLSYNGRCSSKYFSGVLFQTLHPHPTTNNTYLSQPPLKNVLQDSWWHIFSSPIADSLSVITLIWHILAPYLCLTCIVFASRPCKKPCSHVEEYIITLIFPLPAISVCL